MLIARPVTQTHLIICRSDINQGTCTISEFRSIYLSSNQKTIPFTGRWTDEQSESSIPPPTTSSSKKLTFSFNIPRIANQRVSHDRCFTHNNVVAIEAFRITDFCDGNAPLTSGLSSHRTSTAGFNVPCVGKPNKLLNK